MCSSKKTDEFRSTSFGSEHEIAYGRIPTRYNRIHGVSSPTTGSKNSYKIWYHHGETDYEHGSTSEPQPAVRLEEPIRTDVDYGVDEEAKKLFPQGFKTAELPSKKGYLRVADVS
ncbi:hypothetical protein DY000_02048073 [Brassica cretica]|uniref:Uncharacterized protein n=1 Tax=Brassica cretica TaxID=69181 RepID=A0ABQ7F873_BRACR|nr:hypothetical protein DY000_02048073 [Brassica cretica]